MNNVGRPTEYNDEILVKAREYIDSCEDEVIERTKMTNPDKGYETYEYSLNVNLPSIEGLALYLGVSRQRIYDWEKKFDEFRDIIDELRAKQAQKLLNKGLSGDYNPTIAKVLLTKHGYKEGVENDVKVELPKPILDLNKDVHSDNSNQENSESIEKN